ncbi:MAG: NAD(P)-dependent oxidoreductase [candidate division WOR-3 bacterium]|nr:MAG: NAD(P)-dependent oxidoreductase [candidate division WOR-3 bacterium]
MEFDNLITNPFGFGERLILELLRRGESVFAIFPTAKDVPMSFLGKKNIKYGFCKLEHDPILEKILPRRIKHVFHLFEAYSGRFSKLFKANALATLLLLDWAKAAGVQSFTYLSSGEVYGTGENIEEGAALEPRGFYGTTKFQAEMLLRFYKRSFTISIVRLFFPFGHGLEQGFVFDLARSIEAGEPFQSAYNKVSPSFADDAVLPLINARDQKEGDIYNICGSETSVAVLAEKIGEAIGKAPKRVEAGKHVLTGSSKQAREKIGYAETVFDDAIGRSFAHMK